MMTEKNTPDPARVARWEFLVQNTASYWPRQKAEAAMRLADEERADLVAEVERLREVVDRSDDEIKRSHEQILETLDRAHAAEAKVAKVEALADELDQTIIREQPLADRHAGYYAGVVSARQKVRNDLRAVLADAPAERPDLDRPCACGHLLTDHLDGLACYAGTTVTSEFACDCREWRPGAPAEQQAEGGV